MSKVYFIQSHGVPVGEEKVVKIPTGETRKSLLGGVKEIYRKEKRWEQTGFSQSKIDIKRLANEVAETIEEIEKAGLVVDSITPITSGNYDWEFKILGRKRSKKGGGYGFGYGYSYTEGVIIVAKEPDSTK
ncbi:MAG: hypothetical protein AAFQ68_09530 [Bacteroidota bacterium]